MNRKLITLACSVLVAVVAGGAIVLSQGEDPPTKTSTTTEKDPPARSEQATLLAQAKEQAKSMEQAQDELKRKADEVRQAQRHEFRVTIREEPPYDAYKPDAGGYICIRATNVPSQLVVDAGADYPKVLAEEEIPGTAKLKSGGICEATLTIVAPFSTHYRLGVAIEGHGMILPTDPGETELKPTDERPQKVVVLR